jgi:hypothetical protein
MLLRINEKALLADAQKDVPLTAICSTSQISHPHSPTTAYHNVSILVQKFEKSFKTSQAALHTAKNI